MNESPSFEIRPARPGDADAIGVLAHRAAATDAPVWTALHPVDAEAEHARSVIDAADPGRVVLVAVDRNDQVLGFVTASRSPGRAREERGHINSLAVRSDAEGRGVARALLAAAEGWCREHGLAELTLDVYPGNDRARRLYERAGYEPEWLHLRKSLA